MSWTSLISNAVRVLSFLATAVMTGCAGSRTSNNTVISAGSSSMHTVDLSWSASASPDISGYNVHRAVYTDSCGSFHKINRVLITATSYTDSEVADGASYCYATTAADVNNRESAFSNIVANVQIPAF